MFFIGDQRTVDILWFLPAKGLVEAGILGSGGQVFIAPHHMGNFHQMVVHYICKIVGGIAIGLDQDHIVKLFIGLYDGSVNLIVEGCFSDIRYIGPYYKGLTGC